MATTKAQKSKRDEAKSKKSKGGKRAGKTRVAKAAKNGNKTKKSTAKAGGNGSKVSGGQARTATQEGKPPKDTRQLVQERKILRSQSRWLQKALFALSKAEDDQTKLAEVRGDDHEPMAVTIDGTTHEVGAVTDSLRDSVMDRLEHLRVTLRREHALLG
jgi:hypothetical protein